MLNLFKNTALPALEQTVSFAQQRHTLLAGNVANIDTPNYRSRDLDVSTFQDALARSIQAQNQVGQLSPVTRDDLMRGPRQATEQIVFHDGSDVSLESQVTELTKNQHMHNLAIATMRSQMGLLQAAVSERA